MSGRKFQYIAIEALDNLPEMTMVTKACLIVDRLPVDMSIETKASILVNYSTKNALDIVNNGEPLDVTQGKVTKIVQDVSDVRQFHYIDVVPQMTMVTKACLMVDRLTVDMSIESKASILVNYSTKNALDLVNIGKPLDVTQDKVTKNVQDVNDVRQFHYINVVPQMTMVTKACLMVDRLRVDMSIESQASILVNYSIKNALDIVHNGKPLDVTQDKVDNIVQDVRPVRATSLPDIVNKLVEVAKPVPADMITTQAEPVELGDTKLQLSNSQQNVTSHGDIAIVKSKSDLSVPSGRISQAMLRTSSKSCSDVSAVSQLSTEIVNAHREKLEVDVQIFGTSTSMSTIALFDDDQIEVEKPKKKKGLRRFFSAVGKFFRKRIICC